MSTLFKAVRCLDCGHEMGPDPFREKCEACGGPWMDALYDCAALPRNWSVLLKERPTTLWRYTELLPFSDDIHIVSMSEGWTPLTRAEGLEQELGHPQIWIKDERQNPTNSFKDRQAALAVTALCAQGIKEVVMASTGNAAAAYSAYCARKGIKLWVFLTSSVPVEKMRELALYGAEVVKITGTYDQAKGVAADFAARHNLALERGPKAIPCKESMKTVAFEIAEQLGWRAPDWYIQAVSGGIGPLGVIKGFIELYDAGLIDRVPKLGVIQTEGCAPMVRAWEQGLDEAEPVQPDSLITVLATGTPGKAYTMLKQAIDRYGGAMAAVSDGDAFRAMRRVARLEGLSMEPAASVAFAGMARLVEQQIIRPDECVIVNCSGHTFSAEKHALEDRYFLSLDTPAADLDRRPVEGVAAALEQLDEQITTIVVIDDNPNDSRLIRRLLQSYKQYRVFESNNALDGLDLVRQRQPDLVVLDLTMPTMDGFETLSELKADARTCDIPVVVVSAKALSLTEQDYLKRHTDSVWQKGSFNAQELVQHVSTLLGGTSEGPKRAAPGQTSQGSDRLMGTFGKLNRQRVLLVEESSWDARLLRRLVESRSRFEVIEAQSGAEALVAVAEAPFDLIILGLQLPDMTGEQVLVDLRAREGTRHAPVVIITEKQLDSVERARLGAKVESVWSKSTLDRSSLLSYIENLLPE